MIHTLYQHLVSTHPLDTLYIISYLSYDLILDIAIHFIIQSSIHLVEFVDLVTYIVGGMGPMGGMGQQGGMAPQAYGNYQMGGQGGPQGQYPGG